ncbi:MAG: 50S ribosomal protein L20 [Bdellovibrionales bacterium]|nr:50S ribosomal protein L20 [Bdellovibrionales bacterium]
MARVKRGTKARARRKRVLDKAEGFRGRRKNCFTLAVISVQKSLKYAYVGRKQKKRKLRALWIQRVNAAARAHGLTYSRLIPLLKKSGITMDRKILSQMAIEDPTAFEKVIEVAKASA